MKFNKSDFLTLGMELELQILDSDSPDLAKGAIDVFSSATDKFFIKHEITTDMLEINSSVHADVSALSLNMFHLTESVCSEASRHHLRICGGGSHPLAHWYGRHISDTPWCNFLADKYQYLAKKNAVFGMHIHIGVSDGDTAISLSRSMTPFVPFLIAMSSSSPFLEGHDTGFDSSRLHGFRCAPTTGAISVEITHWEAYISYVEMATTLNIIENAKEIYWDIRPKPEFGTIEVRVFDTPICLKRACQLAAFTQTLAAYLQAHKMPDHFDRRYYEFNVFQACRYGLNGSYIDSSGEKSPVSVRLRSLFTQLDQYATALGCKDEVDALGRALFNVGNDSTHLRSLYKAGHSIVSLVNESCIRLLAP